MEMLEEVVSWVPDGELNVSVQAQGLYILNYNVNYPRMENNKMRLEFMDGEGCIEIDQSEVNAVETYETEEEDGYRIMMNGAKVVEIFTLRGLGGVNDDE